MSNETHFEAAERHLRAVEGLNEDSLDDRVLVGALTSLLAIAESLREITRKFEYILEEIRHK